MLWFCVHDIEMELFDLRWLLLMKCLCEGNYYILTFLTSTFWDFIQYGQNCLSIQLLTMKDIINKICRMICFSIEIVYLCYESAWLHLSGYLVGAEFRVSQVPGISIKSQRPQRREVVILFGDIQNLWILAGWISDCTFIRMERAADHCNM